MIPSLSKSPPGWTVTTLDALISNIEAGKSFKCDERPPVDHEIGVVKVSAVTWGIYNEAESKTCTNDELIDADLFIRPGDFLFSRANTIELVGACVIAEQVTRHIMLSDKILRFKIFNDFDRWILWSLRSAWGRSEIERLATGNQESMRNIGQERIRQIRIAIPPIRERNVIVDAIESYLSRLDAATASLERVQAKLKAYRASVLKAAVEGRLVPTEAELARGEGRDYEPASVLLDRILKERRRLWEEAELARLTKSGKPPKDDKWKAKYEEPAAPDTSKLPKLPEGWCWAMWSQIGFSQNGRPFPSNEYQNTGVRLLRPGNLFDDGQVKWTDKNTRCLPQRWADEYPGHLVGPGEIVMNLTAQSLADDFLGRVCITPAYERCLLNQRIARLTPVLCCHRYLLWMFKSPWFRRFVSSLNTGSLIQHMFTSQLDNFSLPLPPLEEQERISDEIDRLLTVAGQCDAIAHWNSERSGRLRQSILKWAFEGKLVDQDPNDEPAEALLARIRAERAAAPVVKTRGRKAKAS